MSRTRKSPGIRRRLAALGDDAPFKFKRCSQQMKLLAAVEITAKGVERTAEAIGEDVAAREAQEIQRALPLPLPGAVGGKVPLL